MKETKKQMAERKVKELFLLNKHRVALQKLSQPKNEFAIYKKGNQTDNTFYLQMENVCATILKKRRPSGTAISLDKCPIRTKTLELKKKCWPEEEVAKLVKAAEKSFESGCPSVLSYLKTAPGSTGPELTAPGNTGPEPTFRQHQLKPVQKNRSPEKVPMKGKAMQLALLAETIGVDRGGELGSKFTSNDQINRAVGGMAKEVEELDVLGRQAKEGTSGRMWTQSKVKTHRAGYNRCKNTLGENLSQLLVIIEEKEDLQKSDKGLMERMKLDLALQPRLLEAIKASLKSVELLKGAMKTWKRTVKRKMASRYGEVVECQLEPNRLGLDWVAALEEVDRKLQLEPDSRQRNPHRERKLAGFTLLFYMKVYDYFSFKNREGSDFVDTTQLMMALQLPASMTKQVVAAIKAHLPVSKLHFGRGEVVLIDNQRMLEDPALVAKVITLESLKPKNIKVIRATVVRRSKEAPGSRRYPARKRFHELYPDILEAVRELVAGSGDKEIAADPRRKNELGLARVAIPDILKKLKSLYPVGHRLPGRTLVRQWMTAPTQSNKYSEKYLNLIPARIPQKVESYLFIHYMMPSILR